MATKTKMRVVETAGVLVWSDRVSGREVFKFDTATVAPTLRDRVFAYGAKQIIADGAAGSRDPAAAMRERAKSLTSGTWGERVARFPDADIWAAMIALGLTQDSQDKRDKWASLKPAERAAIGRKPVITEWVAAHVPELDVDDLIADF